MPREKREHEIKTAILNMLKQQSPLGYNRLYEQIHGKTRCGRNQFNKYLKELESEAAVSPKRSSTHKTGVALELGPGISKFQKRQFRFIAENLLPLLLPFAEFRETGSIEEQLARYDLLRLLPFRVKIELTSSAHGKRKIVAEATLEKDGSVSDSRIFAT